jgi:hypothetical protein
VLALFEESTDSDGDLVDACDLKELGVPVDDEGSSSPHRACSSAVQAAS